MFYKKRDMQALTACSMVMCVAAGAVLAGRAGAVDIFGTEHGVAPSPEYPLTQGADPNYCRYGAVSTPLSLYEAIERALCEGPRTRVAWVNVKAAAAAVGVAKSAYLPTLDLAADYARAHDVTKVSGGPPELGTNYTQNTNAEQLQLAWVLFDFGGRSATLKGSRELLLAAQATQNGTLQTAFATTAKDYYTAQAASARVKSTLSIESAARKSLDAASARYKTGVAPVTDQLQANTAYAQAVYERAAAEGTYESAIGVLAIDMSLPADHPLTMPALDQGALPDTSFVRAVHDLVDEATRAHPTVLAAQAQYQAALANVDLARAAGLPKISLAGTYTRETQPLNQTIGTLAYPSHTRAESIGVNLTMPLFQGFGEAYKIRQAKDEALAQEQAVREAQQSVASEVWTGVQTLKTDTENLKNTDTVVKAARATFEAAEQRYQSGVGNILELLNSQTTLSNAELQYIQAQLEWRNARLQLAASLGTLGLWAIK